MRQKLLLVTALFTVSMVPALLGHSLGEDHRPSPTGRSWALVGGTVYVSPTEPPIKDGVIVVEGGTITTVGQKMSVHLPTDIEKLNCSGLDRPE